MPDTPRDWAEVVGILVLILLYLVRMVWSMLTPKPETNGYDKRLRETEKNATEALSEARHLKERIEALHKKASDEGDRAQKFIDGAEQRFVLAKVCDERHERD